MNIGLFKAKLHRWIFRGERESREAKECNKCCLTCQRYFVCADTDGWIRAIKRANKAIQDFNETVINAMNELNEE